jgi:hypothetical protein
MFIKLFTLGSRYIETGKHDRETSLGYLDSLDSFASEARRFSM